MLFLELGITPFRDIIRKRRLGFLHYILHENKNSMISKVFETQRKNKSAKDWVTTILDDLKELNLNVDFEDIRSMTKGVFMNKVKRKTEEKVLEKLEKMKEKHSKVNFLNHPILKMQKYLMPTSLNIRKEECQEIFKLRSKVTDVKMNMKNKYESNECEACGKNEETQEHVLLCEIILNMHEDYEKSEKEDYEKIENGSVKEKLQNYSLKT